MDHALEISPQKEGQHTDLECFFWGQQAKWQPLVTIYAKGIILWGLLAELKDSWVSRAPFWLLEAIRSQSSDGLLKAALPSSLLSINTPLVSAEPSVGAQGLLLLMPAAPNSRVYHYVHVACILATSATWLLQWGVRTENLLPWVTVFLPDWLWNVIKCFFFLLSLKFPFLFYFYLLGGWRREIALQSRALAIPPEDSSLVPITHTGWLTVPSNCRTSGSDSSGLCGHLHMRVTHTK